MCALLAHVDDRGARPEALARAHEACRALDPDPIAILRATEGLAPDERSSLARLLQRLVDLNAVARDAVSHAKAATESEIEKTRVLQDRLRHLAGLERSGIAFDAIS